MTRGDLPRADAPRADASRAGRPQPGRPGGLLAVHAHPDDETLATGALLATWAASGAPVTVVTCTRGERGEVIPSALAHLAGDGPALAAHRERELAGALQALGVADHAFLDALPAPGAPADGSRYEDSGMAWVSPGRAGPAVDSGAAAFARVPVDDAAARLAVLIRGRRPDVVVGYEPGGGYGHPDHVQAHRVMTRAVALAADPALETGAPTYSVPVVLWAALDEEMRVRGESSLAARVARPGRGLRHPEPGRAAPSAAVPAADIDVRVPMRPVLDRVAAALRAHGTQVQAVVTWPDAGAPDPALGHLALSDGVLRPIPRREAYHVARGRAADVGWPAGVAWLGDVAG